MRSERCFATILLFIFFEGTSQSQTDSLKHELAKASTDTVRIGLYHQLAVLHSALQPDEALAYELQALTIAEKGKHYPRATLTLSGKLREKICFSRWATFTSHCGAPPAEIEIANPDIFQDEYTIHIPLNPCRKNAPIYG